MSSELAVTRPEQRQIVRKRSRSRLLRAYLASMSAIAISRKLTSLFRLETAYEREVSITDRMPDLFRQTEPIEDGSTVTCIAYSEETAMRRINPLESPRLRPNTDPWRQKNLLHTRWIC